MPRRTPQPADRTRRELVLRFVAFTDELDDLYDAVVRAREAGTLTTAEGRDALPVIELCKTELETARPRLIPATD